MRARHSPFERVLLLFAQVQPGEGRGVALMLAQAFVLLLAYYLIRPVREALVLAEGSPEIRSYAVGAVALALILLLPLYRHLYDRLGTRRDKSTVLRWVLAFFAANLLVFAALGWRGVPVGVPFFIWVGVFSVMLVAQFWAFAADLFNLRTGQRLFAVIAIGSALGALAGSQLSARLFAVAGPYRLMLASALLLGVVAWLGARVEPTIPPDSLARPVRVRARAPAHPPRLGGVFGGFGVLVRSRYLLLIAAFITLVNWVNATGGYILASFVAAHAEAVAGGSGVGVRDAIGRFYGDYFAWITLLQLLLQMFVVSRVIRWFGIRGALLVLPVVMAANYGLVAVFPVFTLVRVMMITETSCNYSLHATASHSLYLPLSRREKYVGKTTIDTFFFRFGDLLQTTMVFAASNWLAIGLGGVMVANLGLSLVALAVALAIGRLHRGQVRAHLRNAPPTTGTPLRDVYVPAGQSLRFEVPEHAFIDPDPGESLVYLARGIDGVPLPHWVDFDRAERSFLLRPPAGSSGCVEVELVATDLAGRQVTARFRVVHGGDVRAGFSDWTGAPGPAAPGHGPGRGSDGAPRPPGSRG